MIIAAAAKPLTLTIAADKSLLRLEPADQVLLTENKSTATSAKEKILPLKPTSRKPIAPQNKPAKMHPAANIKREQKNPPELQMQTQCRLTFSIHSPHAKPLLQTKNKHGFLNKKPDHLHIATLTTRLSS
ncbi:MAG: hypothetical protein IBX47_06680 [Desulfuromonadales bacterium]|nr:hypothetical protein [Desulfuromonadales bacterium]